MPTDRDSFQRYVPVQPDRSDDSASGASESHQQPADPVDVGSVAAPAALPTPSQQHGDGEYPVAEVIRYFYASRCQQA